MTRKIDIYHVPGRTIAGYLFDPYDLAEKQITKVQITHEIRIRLIEVDEYGPLYVCITDGLVFQIRAGDFIIPKDSQNPFSIMPAAQFFSDGFELLEEKSDD